MTFGLAQTRYSHDDNHVVYDNLIEYCIDFICGEKKLPHFLHFALNRVFREYLHGMNHSKTRLYRVLPTRYHPHIGVFFETGEGFVKGPWIGALERLKYRENPKRGSVAVGLVGERYITDAEVDSLGDDRKDLTFILACLLLCRNIANERLTNRYRNSHKGNHHGKDQASL